MKTSIRLLLLLSLCLANTAVFAENRAIQITLSDSRALVDNAAAKEIRQTLGNEIANGNIEALITYNHELGFKNQLVTCVQVKADTTKAKFNSLVQTLRAVKPRTSASYDLKLATTCSKNNDLVCPSGLEGCFTKEFIESAAYTEYVSRQQFAAGLADILPGKTLMSLKLNEGDFSTDLSNPASIELPASTKNCSAIAVSGDVAAGIATISCTLTGNAAMMGKVITLTHDYYSGGWICDSDLDDDAKQKYAGKCRP